eukprot:3149802-Pyramimonas_sp.AAC.1
MQRTVRSATVDATRLARSWTTNSRQTHPTAFENKPCRVSIRAIIQATAVAETSRALWAKTAIPGQHCYDEGDLVDYHRPTTTKDDWACWNGPFPAVRIDPDRGQVIMGVGNRD